LILDLNFRFWIEPQNLINPETLESNFIPDFEFKLDPKSKLQMDIEKTCFHGENLNVNHGNIKVYSLWIPIPQSALLALIIGTRVPCN